jgi:hypothetical protein
MDSNIKSLAISSGMKLKEFYPDEKKTMGWINITCTEFELERFTTILIQARDQVYSQAAPENTDEKIQDKDQT